MIEVIFKIFLTDYIDFQGVITKRTQKPLLIEYKNGELVLGPFQGSIACTRIPFGKGVCGYAWQQAQIVIVPDVEQFPGHIACSSLSRSEIVVPVIKNGEVQMVLDVDSTELNGYDETDRLYLEELAQWIADRLM
jgi:GAF domain-containing protein